MTETVNSSTVQQANILRDLFHHAPIGVLRMTMDGYIVFANQSFVGMLGYKDFGEFCALTGQSVKNLNKDVEERNNILAKMNTSGRPVHFDSTWLRKDGTSLICRVHIRASFNSEGSIEFFDGLVEDISELKSIEGALLASGERYQSIFENTGTGTIIIEKDTTISLANAGFLQLTGYSKEEVEGKMKWPVLIAKPDDLARMLSYHYSRRDASDKVPIEYEFTLKDKQNSFKDVFLRVDMIAGTDSSVASLLDTTSLKRTRRDLHESESRLSGILEAFDCSIYICSPDYHLTYLNRKLKKSLKKDESSGVCYTRLFDFTSPCSWCVLKGILQGKTEKYEYLNPGDKRWYYAVSSPIYEAEDVITQMQTVIIDIHKRKTAEMALKERENYLHKENLRLRENIRDRYKFGSIIGKSSAMQKVYELVLRAAATDANVILYGESGTGKELVAREIHNISDRGKRTFLPVNCGAIPSQLMESEFFGYRRGAFTGADKDKPGYFFQADNGTLFLDELGEIPEAMQVKLLRVLEGHGYTPIGDLHVNRSNVRIIAATNRNLRKMLDDGVMREDFFYRIHIIPVHIPPLRERLEDIPLLVEYFLKKHAEDSPMHNFSGHQLEMLMQHDWPGNVRELENTIQRYLNLNVLEFPGGKSVPQQTVTAYSVSETEGGGVTLRQAVKQFEKDFLVKQLGLHKWNRTETAEALGIQRKTLYLKMKQLRID